jgi:hypothetical protein
MAAAVHKPMRNRRGAAGAKGIVMDATPFSQETRP